MTRFTWPAPARAALLALLPAALLLSSCSTEPGQGGQAPDGGTPPVADGAGAPAGQAATAQFETPRKAEGQVFIYIVTNGISPFWTPMAVGMEHAAKDLGCKAEWAGPQNSTVAEQKRIVEDALSKGADGIAISCIEPEASIPIIEMVIEKGVPCITFDADSPDSKRLCYIGTNNVNAGKAAGEAAAELLPGGGKMMGFVGNISSANARERRDGFVETASKAGIELVDVMDDNKDAARARRNVEDVIAKEGANLVGFLGLFSYNGPAIAQAVSNSGKRSSYKIIAFDAEPVTLDHLKRGTIDATVVQKPYDFGKLSTELLYHINREGWSAAAKRLKIPEDGLYDTGVKVITPRNVNDYIKELEKLGIKSS